MSPKRLLVALLVLALASPGAAASLDTSVETRVVVDLAPSAPCASRRETAPGETSRRETAPGEKNRRETAPAEPSRRETAPAEMSRHETAPAGRSPGAARLELAPGASLDRYARLPEGARLLFAVEPPSREPPRVTLAADGAGEKEISLERVGDAAGRWQAALAAPEGEPVRLRFANRGTEPIALRGARIEGAARPRPAPLAEAAPAKPPTEAAPAESPNQAAPPEPPNQAAPAQPPNQAEPPEPPNVVVYLIDALRPDRLSAYGYERETSPRIDAVARRGVLFTDAYAPGPSTLHSLPALFASRHASELWALREGGGAEWTLAERLRDAGFQTAAFQANPWVRPGLGFARGFDTYEMVQEKGGGRAPATRVNERALAWLRERDRERPYFLFVQTLDVHTPYDPPEELREKFARPSPQSRPEKPRVRRPLSEVGRGVQAAMLEIVGGDPAETGYLDPARYDGAVAYADRELGRFLDGLAAESGGRPTVLVITADHGESLGNLDDGTYVHGHSLYEEQVRVPLIVELPGRSGERRARSGSGEAGAEGGVAGTRATEPVSLLDLAPTLLDVAGVSIPDDARGRSLLRPAPGDGCPPAAIGVLLEEALDVQPAGDMERPRPIAEWFVREGPWKLLGGEKPRLFHLPSDPLEQSDRSAERPVLAAYLDARAEELREKPAASQTKPSPLPDAERRELEKALRALGYAE